jgi:hypothetical protein
MNALPFRQPGRFYRGNLHTHSTNSDGDKTLEQVVESYRHAGYDFVAITDHFLERYRFPISDTLPFRTAQFTTLLGAELHAGQVALGGPWHILAVGLPLDFAPTRADESAADLCARARAAGAFVAAAHPYWYGLTSQEILALGRISAIETYNATCQALNDRGDSWPLLDALLAQGQHYLSYAADDAHFHPHRPDWQQAWVQVKASHLDPQALLDALLAGHFYSSTGPELHDIRVEVPNQITVLCSPCHAIFVAGQGSWARQHHGQQVTHATFALEGCPSPYLRVTVRDALGRRAWSNPLWL